MRPFSLQTVAKATQNPVRRRAKLLRVDHFQENQFELVLVARGNRIIATHTHDSTKGRDSVKNVEACQLDGVSLAVIAVARVGVAS